MPATRKNNFAAHQTENAGAEMLKSALSISLRRFEIQNEITNASSATMMVPAAGP